MTAPPENFADRPAAAAGLLRPAGEFVDPAAPKDAENGLDLQGQPYDLLSELLRSVRLSGERIVAYAPQRTVAVSFADIGTVHLIDEGELVLQVDGNPHVQRVIRGDVILLPRGDPHHISDAGNRAHTTVRAGASDRDAPVPEPARWLCGTFTIGDPQASHLLASLPPVIILRGGGGQSLEGLEVARRMLLFEMQSPSQGSAVMVSRILDLVFIQILRIWAAGTDAKPNWLAGALDPQIGPALSAIHRRPDHDWTVEELARACSLSRSAFAARFSARVGKPPATCSAKLPFRSRSSRRRSATRPRRRSAVRSSTATAHHRLAGDGTPERNTRERPAVGHRCAAPHRPRCLAQPQFVKLTSMASIARSKLARTSRGIPKPPAASNVT
jgi:AraC-like DNA-binding protein